MSLSSGKFLISISAVSDNFEAMDSLHRKLHDSVRRGNLEEAGPLVGQGADVNWRNPKNDVCTHYPTCECGTTSLHIAVDTRNAQMVEYLLQRRAELNMEDVRGKTPLQRLLAGFAPGIFNVVRVLVDAGADVNSRDFFDRSILLVAVMLNDFSLAEYLLSSGANPDAKDCNGDTPLSHICSMAKSRCLFGIKRMMKILLRSGADVDLADDFGRTPVMNLVSILGSRTVDRQALDLLKFFMQYCDFGRLSEPDDVSVGANLEVKKVVLAHLAMLAELESPLDSTLLRSISNDEEFKNYFNECKEELRVAKSTRHSWPNFFDLLTGGKGRLRNYAGNVDLIQRRFRGDPQG